MLFALCFPATAQQPGKIPKVGLLTERREVSANIEAFEQELRRLGYVEGKNLAIERRNTVGDATRLPTLTAELVQQRVDVILAPGTPAALAAKNATRTVPIVFATVSDAVRSGLVESLARPGGNLTGLTQISPDLAGKRLEILRESVPRLSRVAILLDRTVPQSSLSLAEAQAAARQFGIRVQKIEIADRSALETAFHAMINGRASALIVISSGMFLDESKQIADLAKKHRLPNDSHCKGIRGCRRSHELRSEYARFVQTRSDLRGQDFERN
jgi:putative ABC transport system substrate-binding protein